jgi:hypothetical protein
MITANMILPQNEKTRQIKKKTIPMNNHPQIYQTSSEPE